MTRGIGTRPWCPGSANLDGGCRGDVFYLCLPEAASCRGPRPEKPSGFARAHFRRKGDLWNRSPRRICCEAPRRVRSAAGSGPCPALSAAPVVSTRQNDVKKNDVSGLKCRSGRAGAETYPRVAALDGVRHLQVTPTAEYVSARDAILHLGTGRRKRWLGSSITRRRLSLGRSVGAAPQALFDAVGKAMACPDTDAGTKIRAAPYRWWAIDMPGRNWVGVQGGGGRGLHPLQDQGPSLVRSSGPVLNLSLRFPAT